MNTFMQSHSHTLIMTLGWGIGEHSHVHNNITPLSLAVWNIQEERLIIYPGTQYHKYT